MRNLFVIMMLWIVSFAPSTVAIAQDSGQVSSAGETANSQPNAAANAPKSDTPQEKEAEPVKFNPFTDTSFTDQCGTDWYNCHGQTTVISQSNGPFRSPYSGPNSFRSANDTAVSETATLFIGARLGGLGELYFDPEIAGGRGLSDVFGVGGQPNGDITRVGALEPTPYIARLYVQHDFALGCETEKVESDANQLAGERPVSRITVAVGKMASTDWFDKNKYSDDPRSQFMNWALMYNGAWDYPADVRGYSWGGVIEWNEPNFAVRWGIFAEPTDANGSELDPNFGEAHGQALEFEQRYSLCGHPGKARWMAYLNQGFMGTYSEALALSPINPNAALTRTYNNVGKYGFCLNLEQEFTENCGGFLRLGWNNGQTETWAFTEIDQTLSMGITHKATWWSRPQDEIGVGVALNGLSSDHRAYLAAGGLGFELGDGKLSYGLESDWEVYYRWEMSKNVALSPDFQLIQNPGYNTDRGPVFIAGARLHAEF